jgi:hypothetical protein
MAGRSKAGVETIGLFGSNIENADLELINKWNYQA